MNRDRLQRALFALDGYALEGRHDVRVRLARYFSGLYPTEVRLHVHLIEATFEREGLEAARGALQRSAGELRHALGKLPSELVAFYRRLASDTGADSTAKGKVIRELRIVTGHGVATLEVGFADGSSVRMSEAAFERLYGLRPSRRVVA